MTRRNVITFSILASAGALAGLVAWLGWTSPALLIYGTGCYLAGRTHEAIRP